MVVAGALGQALGADCDGVLTVKYLTHLTLGCATEYAHRIVIRAGSGIMNEFVPPLPVERLKAQSQDLAPLGRLFHGDWLPSWFIGHTVNPLKPVRTLP